MQLAVRHNICMFTIDDFMIFKGREETTRTLDSGMVVLDVEMNAVRTNTCTMI
jgi:hypothetical protein